MSVELRLSAGGPPQQAASSYIYTDVRYLIEEFDGGSGGALYRLTAWRETQGGWIVMTAERQNEAIPPSFDTAWAMFMEARLIRAENSPGDASRP